jgi:protein TonB
MMQIMPRKLIPGVMAVGIYFFVIILLVVYFNSKEHDKAKSYVKKDEHRIQVGLSSPSKIKKTKDTKKKQKVKPKKKAVKKKVVKKQQAKPKKSTQKKVIKEKIVKKVKPKVKPKNNTKDLFAKVNAPKNKNLIQVTEKPIITKPKHNILKTTDAKTASQRINESLKEQKSTKSGVESAYLAKVQSMLEGWPAQSEYAGEKVKVILYINQNGFFEFKITSASSNVDFNDGLTEYLEQLQEFGFGRHNGGRTYKFEAEFVAKG